MIMIKTKAYQLRIEINGSNPVIWRSITIPEYLTFADLHEAIQTMFGWQDYHMYKFDLEKEKSTISAVADVNPDSLENDVDAETILLSDYLMKGYSFTYIYDMGDYWQHNITVEDELEQEENYIVLLGYEGDNLAEDAGAIHGYYDKLKEMAEHPGGEMCQWFEMQHIDFDEEEVKAELAAIPFEDDGMNSINDEIENNFDSVFEYVEHDSLIRVYRDDQPYYVWFHNGATQTVHIFDTEADCVMASLGDLEKPCPLYYKGISIIFPDYIAIAEGDATPDMPLELLITRVDPKDGMRDLKDEELQNLAVLSQILAAINFDAIIEYEFLPMIFEECLLVDVHVDDKGETNLELKEMQLTMDFPSFEFTEQEIESFHRKVNTDRLVYIIFTIENIINTDLDKKSVHHLFIQGKKYSECRALEGSTFQEIVPELKAFWLDYFRTNGRPIQVSTEDSVLYNTTYGFFKSIKVKAELKRVIMSKVEKAYTEAFFQVNQPDIYLDSEYLEKLNSFDEEQFQNHVEHLNSEEIEKFKQHMDFVRFVKINTKPVLN